MLDAEQFNPGLQIFFNAESAFIGDAALEHRSGGPQSQRTGSRCQPSAGGSGDRGGHFRTQAQGLIRDQSHHITAGDRPSGLERVETFHPRGRDFVIPPLAVDSCQLFAEKTIVFNLPGIEIPAPEAGCSAINGASDSTQDPMAVISGAPKSAPRNGLTWASTSTICRCSAGPAATTRPSGSEKG